MAGWTFRISEKKSAEFGPRNAISKSRHDNGTERAEDESDDNHKYSHVIVIPVAGRKSSGSENLAFSSQLSIHKSPYFTVISKNGERVSAPGSRSKTREVPRGQ